MLKKKNGFKRPDFHLPKTWGKVDYHYANEAGIDYAKRLSNALVTQVQ